MASRDNRLLICKGEQLEAVEPLQTSTVTFSPLVTQGVGYVARADEKAVLISFLVKVYYSHLAACIGRSRPAKAVNGLKVLELTLGVDYTDHQTTRMVTSHAIIKRTKCYKRLLFTVVVDAKAEPSESAGSVNK